MTATTAGAQIDRSPAVPSNAHVSFVGALRSEWVKLTSLRSTPWILGGTVVVMVGIALLMAWSATFIFSGDPEAAGAAEQAGMSADPSLGAMAAGAGYGMGQIVVAVLGALVITGEYSTGQIRSTLAAVPTRLPVLAAKGIVVAVCAFVTGLVAVAISALVVSPILSPYDGAVDLSYGGTVRQLIGVPLYLAAIALLGLGIGAMLRNTAGSIAIAVALVFVIPTIWVNLSPEFFTTTYPYLPSAAGDRLMAPDGSEGTLSPWGGFGVLMIWVAAALAGAGVLMRRRDA